MRKIVAPKKRVIESGGRETFELEVEVGGTLRFFILTLEARTDEDGAVVGIVGTAFDLTDRRHDEKRMRLMMRELTHRSKNLLAVIQAMARKTASVSGDMDGFIADFSARLRAMAAAHDLLVSQSWNGADLGDLLRASVAQTIAPTAEQVKIDGPPLMLVARHGAEPQPRLPRARHQRQQVRFAVDRRGRAQRHLDQGRLADSHRLARDRRPAGHARRNAAASAGCCSSASSAPPSTDR